MADIYLDYNATTPIDPQVAEAMLPFVQGGLNGLFGNPSSGHSFGVAARQGVDTARRQVASMLGCDVDDLIFTSGGTEANNHAIKGVAEAYRQRGNHIITTAVEHPAVTEVCRYLEAPRVPGDVPAGGQARDGAPAAGRGRHHARNAAGHHHARQQRSRHGHAHRREMPTSPTATAR